jgi:ABC-type antimicrobial peptide transport system permease subunit
MIKNYLTIALRSLHRYRLYSFLNIAGLGIGLSTSILILLWVLDERSFDRFHVSEQDVYRITADVSGIKVALTPPPMAEQIRSEIAHVTDVCQVASTTRLFTAGLNNFDEKRGLFADTSFFSLFSFPLLKGEGRKALHEPNALLLTEEMAIKYFGNTDALGKIVQIDKQHNFIIRGILKSIPANSHLQFDFILPMSFYMKTEEYRQSNCWDCYYSIYTYVKLTSDGKTNERVPEETAAQINQIYANQKNPMKAGFHLQPLADIHLKSEDLIADIAVKGNIRYVKVFSLVSLFILVVASVNFMNLATAKSASRAKEVGVRKVMGAYPRQLTIQFLGESLVITFMSLCVSLVLVSLVLPSFNDLTEKNLHLSFDLNFVLGLSTIVLLTSLLSGSYPAFYFSRVKSIQSLKGITKAGRKSVWFRNALVVMQFVVTIILIACTSIVYQQLQFIRHQNIGYKKDNLLYAMMNRDMSGQYRTLRSQLEASNVITEYTVVSELPSNFNSATYSVAWEGKKPNEQTIFSQLAIDEHFVKTMGVTLLAGRSFSKDFTADTSNFVVNEKALNEFGFAPSTALGRKLTVNGNTGVIIGVIKDFHFRPIRETIQPLIMNLNTTGGFVLIRSQPGVFQSHAKELQRIFTRLAPSYPFEYGFLDQDFQAMYRTENQTGILSGLFAALAIFIACLGLFGLSAFMAEQRTKEIGVRKVVGAKVAGIVLLLSKDLLRLMIVALLVAVPVAWYISVEWLENYAYHIPVNASAFIFSGALALVMALLTTCFQTIKAALSNPVKSLRD